MSSPGSVVVDQEYIYLEQAFYGENSGFASVFNFGTVHNVVVYCVNFSTTVVLGLHSVLNDGAEVIQDQYSIMALGNSTIVPTNGYAVLRWKAPPGKTCPTSGKAGSDQLFKIVGASTDGKSPVNINVVFDINVTLFR